MPPREWKLRVEDILDAIAKIRRYTEAMTIDTLMADERTVDAVMRNITIIGDASNHVPAAIRNRYPEVSLGRDAWNPQSSGARILRS
jgi:uncharacterized protein with HEPN domain